MMRSSQLSIKRFICGVRNLPETRIIEVEFQNGSVGRYPWVWLRDCSLDPQTYVLTPALKGRKHFMRDFDVNVEPITVDAQDDVIRVEWPDGVSSAYPANWLKARNLSDAAVRAHRRRFYLEDTKHWAGKQFRPKRFPHQQFIDDEKTLHDFLTAVCVDGIALLTGGPADAANVQQSPQQKQEFDDRVLGEIGERIGFAHRTHFGETFEVVAKPDASNMAYATGDELPFHTDFPSLSDPPQLQLLHMCQRAAHGGLSMFVDGFHVAEQMRKNHPEEFKLLCEVPLEYIEEGYDVHRLPGHSDATRFPFDMVARHTVFKLDSFDAERVARVQFGNVMRSWFMDVEHSHTASASLIPRLYDALKRFTELCYHPDNQLTFPLENGDTVFWANTRLLHGRTAYRSAPEGGERRVIGCYFCWDIVKSRVRWLRDRLNHPDNQQSV